MSDVRESSGEQPDDQSLMSDVPESSDDQLDEQIPEFHGSKGQAIGLITTPVRITHGERRSNVWLSCTLLNEQNELLYDTEVVLLPGTDCIFDVPHGYAVHFVYVKDA